MTNGQPPHQPLDTPASRAARRSMTLTAAFLGWMFDGLEMGLFPLVARPALRELMGAQADTNIGTWMAWITAGFLVGAACGGMLFGWLGDRVGRVRAMVWSVLTLCHLLGLCGFAETPLQLADPAVHRRAGHGGRMVAGRGAGDGSLARQNRGPCWPA